ncbi:hypothetical protein AVP_154 [Aerococcus phage vB_AviM_AVP]|nr:hypothetical protein AVP_154 [Aerococcus phage vB_AviM_AVP]
MTLDEIERMMEITKRVREIRKVIDYSIEDMSELLGIEPHEYLVLEAGAPSQVIEAYEVLLDIMETLLELNNNNRVFSIIKSQQYKYSERLLDIRYGLGLTQKEFVKLLGIDYMYYIRLESCDLFIPVEEYIKVVDNIELYLDCEQFYKEEELSQSLYESYIEHDINYEEEG